jgi:hypothetical protein
MVKTTNSSPQTLKEYNERVRFSFDILTGKQFRKLKRKQQRNN